MSTHHRPLIGILVSEEECSEPYFEIVRKAGAEPKRLSEYPTLSEADGLKGALVTGVSSRGRNVYEPMHSLTLPPSFTDPEADCRAMAWLSLLQAWHIPCAGTCLGMQLECVRRGFELKANVPGHSHLTEGTVQMAAQLTPRTLIHEVVGRRTMMVECMHSQTVRLPARQGLRIAAITSDNEVHAVESSDGKSFFGTQFHPELDEDFGIEYFKAMIFHRWRR